MADFCGEWDGGKLWGQGGDMENLWKHGVDGKNPWGWKQFILPSNYLHCKQRSFAHKHSSVMFKKLERGSLKHIPPTTTQSQHVKFGNPRALPSRGEHRGCQPLQSIPSPWLVTVPIFLVHLDSSDFFPAVLTLLVGLQEGHLACKKCVCVLVCWWRRFEWSFERLVASAVTTTSIILSSNDIQTDNNLVPANPGPPGKWPLKRTEILKVLFRKLP